MWLSEDIKNKAKKILSGLTIRQKIGQLNQVQWSGGASSPKKDKELLDMIRNGDVGSVIFAFNAYAGSEEKPFNDTEFRETMQHTAVEESETGIPLLFGRDVIHGHKTVFPVPLAMCASFNFDLIREAYQCITDEALQYGINWLLTPMLDLCRDPRWGRIIECTGEDPFVGEQFAKAAVSGIQGVKVPFNAASCAKHYIGYGASEGGRDYARTEISDYSLYNYYLKAFKAAIDSNVLTVMSSFNEMNGEPVSSSKRLITDILRGELGFDGFVVSDWDAVIQLIKQGVAIDKREAARLALNAGVDIDMVDRTYIDSLEELVLNGQVSMETLDNAVLRILEVKFALNLFENPYIEPRDINIERHIQKANELCRESIVLLKNKDNILPLDRNDKFALAGPMLHDARSILGSWTLDGDEKYIVTIADGIRKYNNSFELDSFYAAGQNRYDFENCETVILALGESYDVTGEARSLSDISLACEQKYLIRRMKKLGKKVVAVISAGRPLALEDIDKDIDAILWVWHGGSRTGSAVAEILFGEYLPCGRLPVTMPRCTGQIPIYYNCPPSGRHVDGYYMDEKIQVNFEDGKSSPLYPFGYGLGYSSIEYSDIICNKNEYNIKEIEKGISIGVQIKNTGNTDMTEVVQCYVRDVKSSLTRPMKELKAVKKIFINKDETVTVEFTLNKNAFGFFASDGRWVIENGEFEIFIGENSLTNRKCSIYIK